MDDDSHGIGNQETSLNKPLLKEIGEEDQSLQIDRTFVQRNRLKEEVCSPILRLIWGKPLSMVNFHARTILSLLLNVSSYPYSVDTHCLKGIGK